VTILRQLRAFAAAPGARRSLALEAAAELALARVRTLGHARSYTPRFGRLCNGAPAPVGPEQEAVAAEVGRMVARVAAELPFRAVCLQQALAVRRMLARRRIPAQVCLGVARDKAARAEEGRGAHAWVTVGAHVHSGGEGLRAEQWEGLG